MIALHFLKIKLSASRYYIVQPSIKFFQQPLPTMHVSNTFKISNAVYTGYKCIFGTLSI